ncbi:ankyrin repeat domain-containing protein [Candidatus Sumerlaeota bacterium]
MAMAKRDKIALRLCILFLVVMGMQCVYFNVREFRMRANVSKTKSVFRNLAQALEAYYVDYGAFPPMLEPHLTASGAFIAEIPTDPFSETDEAYHYQTIGKLGWILTSLGPDGKRDIDPATDYDPHVYQPSISLVGKNYDPGSWTAYEYTDTPNPSSKAGTGDVFLTLRHVVDEPRYPAMGVLPERTRVKWNVGVMKLREAIAAGNAAEVKSLLGQGLNANARRREVGFDGFKLGPSPLDVAVCFRQLEIARFLLREKADSNPRTIHAYGSLLFLALASDQRELADELIGGYAKLEGQDAENMLLLAAKKGQAKIVKQLLDWGVKIDSQSKGQGNTALHFAVINGQLGTTRLLLDCGASLAVLNVDQLSALDIARQKNEPAMIELLKSPNKAARPN